ncbi:MAG: hypothetical protein ACP5NW_03100 [Candidatus Woesearchaeota archaeon]
MRNFRRKGYYFVIDAFIGSTIIFISLMILLGGGVRPSKIQYNYEMAEEYTTFIMTTKIQDLTNPYVNKMIGNEINDTSLSIMEQVDLFYYNGQMQNASGMIHNLTESLIPEKYGFSYNILENSVSHNIYTRPSSPNITEAEIIISSRKITFLQIDSSTMFGPALTEIKIWI